MPHAARGLDGRRSDAVLGLGSGRTNSMSRWSATPRSFGGFPCCHFTFYIATAALPLPEFIIVREGWVVGSGREGLEGRRGSAGVMLNQAMVGWMGGDERGVWGKWGDDNAMTKLVNEGWATLGQKRKKI